MRLNQFNQSLALSSSFAGVIALAFLFAGEAAVAEPAAESTATLEEVVVTARRREEGLQETPVAVSAFSGDQLVQRQVLTTADLTKYVPNLQLDAVAAESGGGGATQVAIRGIGQTDYVLTVEPGVGVYLDEVYVSKSIGSLMDTWDLERVEVLRGPQGTLFGRNTIGGAVLLTTKRPTDEFSFNADVATGEFGRFDGKVAASGALSDSVRVRASAAYLSRDGHVDRVTTGDEQGNVDRLSARFIAEMDLSDSFLATVSFDYSTIDEESPGQVLVRADEAAPFAGLNNSIVFAACDPAVGDPARLTNPNCYNGQFVRDIDSLDSTNTGPNESEADVWGASVKLEWELGVGDFKSITAFRSVDADISQEITGSQSYFNFIGQDIELDQFSQEFQWSGTAAEGKLDYLLGAYYLDEDGSQEFPVDLALVQFTSGGGIENESLALFGEVDYHFSDQLSLAVGVRYTDEERTFSPEQVLRNGILSGAFGGPGTPLFPAGDYTRKDDSLDFSATLNYNFTDNVSGYVRFSEGFKGGGFVMRYFPPVIPGPGTDPDDLVGYAEPETATLYEAGIKAELFDRRLRINTAVFHTAYDDLQITFNIDPDGPGPVGNFVPVLANAGEAEIQGIEVEVEFVANRWLYIDGSVGYLDADYESFSLLAQTQLAALPDEIPNAPEVTFHLGATATFFNNTNGELFLRADYSYKDDQFKEFTNDPTLLQESFSLVDASLNYRTPDQKWQVSLGATNLTDEIYIVSGVSNGGIGYTQAVVSRPREWFLRFNYSL